MENIAKLGDEDKSSSSPFAIARVIDQTFLKKDASEEELKKVFEETKKYGFRALCVYQEHTKAAKEFLGDEDKSSSSPFAIARVKDSNIKVTTLIDAPTGASSHKDRVKMIENAKKDGSDEIELVMKIDDFKNKKYDEVFEDLKELCKILPTKVIIGSGYLTDGEIRKASEMVEEAGAICVKTATVDDPLDSAELAEKVKHIKIMKAAAPGILVKASGAIRNLSDVKMMLTAGADIIGTSSGVEIVNEAQGQNIKNSEEWRKIE